jgi:hypothetical protein
MVGFGFAHSHAHHPGRDSSQVSKKDFFFQVLLNFYIAPLNESQ